jgi:general secretion pathway protein A
VVIGHLVTTQLDADDTLRMVGPPSASRPSRTQKSELLITLEAFLDQPDQPRASAAC